MILATVGTTIPFDELFEEIDRLAGSGAFAGEPVLCQVGQSRYKMQHCESFVGRPTLRDLISESSFVFCHGGAGTVIELMFAKKRFAAFPNPRAAGDHQGKFLEHCSRIAPISWSRNVADLWALMQERRGLPPAEVRSDQRTVADLVIETVKRLR